MGLEELALSELSGGVLTKAARTRKQMKMGLNLNVRLPIM